MACCRINNLLRKVHNHIWKIYLYKKFWFLWVFLWIRNYLAYDIFLLIPRQKKFCRNLVHLFKFFFFSNFQPRQNVNVCNWPLPKYLNILFGFNIAVYKMYINITCWGKELFLTQNQDENTSDILRCFGFRLYIFWGMYLFSSTSSSAILQCRLW